MSKFNARNVAFTVNLIQQTKKEQAKRDNDIGRAIFTDQTLKGSADMKIERISKRRVALMEQARKELSRLEGCITVYDQGRASGDLDKNLDGTSRTAVDYCSSCHMVVSTSERQKNKCKNCGGQVVKVR